MKKNERDDPTVGKIGKVGQLVKSIEIDGPQARTLMKKVETRDKKAGGLVKKIQTNDPKVGKVRNWQELVKRAQEA